MAFVSALPLPLTGASSPSLTSRLPLRTAPTVGRRSLSMVLPNEEDRRIPQGFTAYSETLNGRAAMIGFVAALGAEIIRPDLRITDQIIGFFSLLNPAHWVDAAKAVMHITGASGM